jgi:hypothetical protein
MFSDRRRQARWNLKVHLRVFDQDSGKVLGHVVNLTLKGMTLVSDAPLPAEKKFFLGLEIPTQNDEGERIIVKALSVWNNKIEGQNYYLNGFHIFRLPDQTMATIQKIIEALKIPEDQ